MFPETLCYRDSFCEEHLLVLAEELLGGFDVLGAAGSHHARGEDDNVLIVGVGVSETPI